MQGIGNSEGTSFVYHKNVLLTYNTLIEIQFNKKLSWEDVSIEQHGKNGQYKNDLLYFYKEILTPPIEMPLELREPR